jgi:putative ABC transport system ATP-binding protein
MEIIRVENLGKVYGDAGMPVRALENISLTISRGEFVVIAGPSGSGKTTLLNIIGALDKPTAGKVYLEGEDLSGKSRKELADIRLKKIGFVFQAYNLNPVLSAIENVEFPLVLQGVPARKREESALAMLNELTISELKDKRPNYMSGGEQQRVATARAVVTVPSIVLADEPTANLDSVTAGKLLDLLQSINESKCITFVFSSHDPRVVERARRLILLRDGKIEKDERRTPVIAGPCLQRL